MPKAWHFGSLADSGEIAQSDGFPASAPNVPTGSWAPLNNVAAIDFGVIGESQGGRGIHLRQAYGAVEAFTVAGWLNARDLRAGTGGNRILCALSSPDAPGFELVQRADGSLQLAIRTERGGNDLGGMLQRPPDFRSRAHGPYLNQVIFTGGNQSGPVRAEAQARQMGAVHQGFPSGLTGGGGPELDPVRSASGCEEAAIRAERPHTRGGLSIR